MDGLHLFVAFALLIAILIGAISLKLYSSKYTKTSTNVHQTQNEDEAHPIVRAARGGTARMRQRRGRGQIAAVAATMDINENDRDADEEEEDGEDGSDDEHQRDKGTSKKEAKKKERQARREAEQAAREMKSEKSSAYAERSRQREKEREEEEERQAAELAQFEARRAAEAAAELAKWKDSFSVETEGCGEDELAAEAQSLLEDFVEFIKTQKCVALEDLAAQFKMRTQDVVDRVTSLEESGKISGVMDDRGKFIYISGEEMAAVADYIKGKGRVSIAHLADISSQLINLQPNEEATVMTGEEEELEVESSIGEAWSLTL